MDFFRLDVERSLALHAAVAGKMRSHPEILDRARAKLGEWIAAGGRSAPLWRKWVAILDRPLEQVVAFLGERSDEAAWLRKASPFAGALTPRERLAVLRETRERLEHAR